MQEIVIQSSSLHIVIFQKFDGQTNKYLLKISTISKNNN